VDVDATADTEGVLEGDPSAFSKPDAWGKFAAGIVIITSVVDTVLSIIDIVDVVEQANAMFEKLNGEIKKSYVDYFNGIKDASKAFNAAIAMSSKVHTSQGLKLRPEAMDFEVVVDPNMGSRDQMHTQGR